MPVIVPPPTGEPIVDLTREIAFNRKNTTAFIYAMPVQIELTPSTENRTAAGAVTIQDGEPRPIQTFRLVPMGHTERPVASAGGGGVQRKYDFTLLGEWNCEMAEGDHWFDEVGQHWQIDSVISHNGYERKGMVTSYGRRPRHG